MKKATIPEEKRSQSQGDITTSKPPSKIARVLAYMLNDGSLQRFEAERLGDHCLHSTISSLANGYGLKFQRQLERVPNHWGEPCTVTRYTLPAGERRRASAVLEMLCSPLKQRQRVAA
ncbi:hypothetical protein V0R50_07035 [Pseudomonas sp. 148P]|uniref:Helix-turn-helix domain-containing protein n=1 Tax=Pseudomonas ulcerans TaxID=3115852 RepID=A0ABU7HN84_9PSED|nr:MULTISPECIES: hypothetical protein [unclassified Pseudomonas]MEE1922494.1 hypothetical protein [Pseudomonas sp. 147P]MEE1932968.1 hypothetical protein [Pseudomonas sp. 148P]